MAGARACILDSTSTTGLLGSAKDPQGSGARPPACGCCLCLSQAVSSFVLQSAVGSCPFGTPSRGALNPDRRRSFCALWLK